MEGYEIQNCLDSMKILVDSAEQPTEEYRRRCDSFGVPYERRNLDYADYTYDCLLSRVMQLLKGKCHSESYPAICVRIGNGSAVSSIGPKRTRLLYIYLLKTAPG